MNRTNVVRRVIDSGRNARARWWLALIALAAVVQAGCAARRDPAGPPLQLHRGAWGPRFSYNSSAQQSVFDWASLDTAFVAVLASDSTALEEARKATPFRVASLASYVGMTAFSLKASLSAISTDPDEITRRDVDSVQRDLVIMTGFGVAGMVFEAVGKRYLNRAVSTFNVGETDASRQPSEPRGWLQQSINNFAFSPVFRPGHGVAFVSETRLYVR